MSDFKIRNLITVGGVLLLYLTLMIVIITIIMRVSNEDILMNIFIVIFKLFTNVVTAAVTYFFTRKIIDNTQPILKKENKE